ncbi:MAG: hypothetical protein GX344_13635 [Intrasporangiaceae bacterium]|nr:hypothetical protein [Intrasporangiaceae bacterium]
MIRRLRSTLTLTVATALALSACGSRDDAPPARPTTSPEVTATETTEPAEPTDTPEPTESHGEATGDGEDATHTPDADEPTDGGSADDDASSGEVSGVPVYYLVESPDGPRLVREFRTVPDEGDLVTSAVMAMMSVAPNDPDYWSPWTAPDAADVTRDGDTITVDVPASVFGRGVGAAYEGMAYEQLVYTVTAAAVFDGNPASRVVLLADGARGDGWGHIGVGDVWTRGPQHDVLNQTWILSPAEGQTVPAGEVTIRGYGASFEGNFMVHVNGPGVDVTEPTTGTGMGFGEWEYSLDLGPGEYTVTVENSSGRDDFQPHTDSKTFTVR